MGRRRSCRLIAGRGTWEVGQTAEEVEKPIECLLEETTRNGWERGDTKNYHGKR